MEEENNLEQRITEFLNGKQDDQLLDDVKSSTTLDEDFRQELEDYVLANILLKREGEQQLKEKLTQQLEQNEEILAGNANRNKTWLKWMLMIAGFGLLTVLTILIYPGPEEPQIQYAYSDPATPNVRSINEGEQFNSWNESMKAFEQKDYKKAIEQLEGLEKDTEFMSQHGDNYRIIRAVCSLRLSEYTKANHVLNTISDNSPYYDQALWYQFLCAYESGDENAAKLLLGKIESYQNHYRADKARLFFASLKK